MTKTERPLLRWQAAIQADYLAKLQKDYLLVAVPGAGKTFWTLNLGRALMRSGYIEKILITAPTIHVKEQWATTAHELGLNIAHDYRNEDGSWPRDADGVAITYAQMAKEPALHRFNISRQPTLVVNDEVHHVQDEGSWGKAAVEAFELAAYRIHLSGTPWNRTGYIPWVSYGVDGKVIPDNTYSYYESLVDGVNCDVFFPELGGKGEWDFDGQRISRDSSEIMPERDRARWLSTVLAVPESDYIARAFMQADADISHIRDLGQDRAGGMIIAKDVEHADRIADYIQNTLRKPRPTVITSDKPGAADDLRRFRRSSDRWCVSVRMVSEGVDIPRLRVLIYATNYTTRLFFRQAVGRVIRGPEPPAKVYLPADSQLVEYAREFRDERLEALKKNLDPPTLTSERKAPAPFSPVRGEVSSIGVIHADEIVSQDEIDRAHRKIMAVGHAHPTTEMATLMAKVLRQEGVFTPSPQPTIPSGPGLPLQSERKEALRRAQKKIVSQICSTTGQEHSHVNADLNRQVGIQRVRDATEEELQKRFEYAKQWLGEVMEL